VAVYVITPKDAPVSASALVARDRVVMGFVFVVVAKTLATAVVTARLKIDSLIIFWCIMRS